MLDNTNKDLILYFVIFIIILFIILLPKIKDRKNKDNTKKKNKYKTVLIISILIGLMLLYFDPILGVIVLFLSIIMYYENTDNSDNNPNEGYQDFLDSTQRTKTETMANELKVKNIINSLVKNVKGNFRVLQNQLKSQKQIIENSKNEFKTSLDNAIGACEGFFNTSEPFIDTQSGFTDFNMPTPLKEEFVKGSVPNIRDLVMSEYIGEEELEKDKLQDSNFNKEGTPLNDEYLGNNIDNSGTIFYPMS